MTVDDGGVLRWTPTVASPAESLVVLQVFDRWGAYDTIAQLLLVDGVNRAPTLHLPVGPLTGREGELLEFGLDVIDPEADALTVWADHLPPGATFDAATRTLRWLPDFAAAGTYPGVRFFADDGLHTRSAALTVVIHPAPQAPLFLRPPPFVANEGEPIRFTLQANDVDAAPIRFSSRLLPPGATLDELTGLFEWTPDFTQHGGYAVPFQADNGSRSATQTALIEVRNANAAPVFELLDRFPAREGQPLQFRVFAFDPDNPTFEPADRDADGTLVRSDAYLPTVQYTVEGMPDGATFDAEAQLFNWTPGHDRAGEHVLTLVATDDGDGTGTPKSARQTTTITVANVNRAPTLAGIVNQVMDHGSELRLPLAALDPDGNTLALSAGALPAWVRFDDLGGGRGEFVFTPTRDDRGNTTFTVSARDDGDGGGEAAALSASTSFVLTVRAPNAPPHLQPVGARVTVVGEPFRLVIDVTDGDEDALSFGFAGLPDGAHLTPSPVWGRAFLDWTPSAADIGRHTVLLSVRDSGNGDPADAQSDTQSFTLTVREVNAAPSWIGLADVTAPANTPLALPLTALDPDGDALVYSAANLPAGASIDAIAGVLHWTPTLLQVGQQANVALTASDGSLGATRDITITVTPVNEAPAFVPLVRQSGREGTQLQFTLGAADPNGDTLAYAVLAGLPPGASLEALTGRVLWTPGVRSGGRACDALRRDRPVGGERRARRPGDDRQRQPGTDAAGVEPRAAHRRGVHARAAGRRPRRRCGAALDGLRPAPGRDARCRHRRSALDAGADTERRLRLPVARQRR